MPSSGEPAANEKRQASPQGPPAVSHETGLGNYALNELPQPQVDFTFGFSNLKPEPSSVST